MFTSRDRARLAEELQAAHARIRELESELTRRASRDHVSAGLLSLRAFRAQLDLDLERARRYGRPLTVALLDIDRFRYLNLKHGYVTGDQILVAVGEAIDAQTRTNDLACRVGGDEFAIMFPETDPVGAVEPLARLLVALESLEAGGVHGLSASIGVAGYEPGQTPEQLLAVAGKAIERAREAGGARLSVYVPDGDAISAISAAHTEVIAALASTLEERDRYTADHSQSVVDLAVRVGQELALDGQQIIALRTAALLHDIGKVGVPDEILHKPGPLDEREWEMMKQHPSIGERIIRAIPGMGAVARIVRHEHERWDGSGYPDGIGGEKIPIESRIILACDAYHAMITDRPYRDAMAHREAMAELSAHAGSQFDPQVIEALVGLLYGMRQAGRTAV